MIQGQLALFKQAEEEKSSGFLVLGYLVQDKVVSDPEDQLEEAVYPFLSIDNWNIGLDHVGKAQFRKKTTPEELLQKLLKIKL